MKTSLSRNQYLAFVALVGITLHVPASTGRAESWCGTPSRSEPPTALATLVCVVEETGEINDSPAQAQLLLEGRGVPEDGNLDIRGEIDSATDVDYFRFTAGKGDVIGMATVREGELDPLLAITEISGAAIIENDTNDSASQYPLGTPLPTGAVPKDAYLSWIAPSDGDYLVRIRSADESLGGYTVEIRARRPGMHVKAPGSRQIIFVDFDGATVTPRALFGQGPDEPQNIPALSESLSDWCREFPDPEDPDVPGLNCLSPTDDNAVIAVIMVTIEENLEDLRASGLNGDRAVDGDGYFDFELRNSSEHIDPFGQPNVSRVIVGGDRTNWGFSWAIAQSVDPGNFATEETVAMNLHLFKLHPAADIEPWNGGPGSINSLPRDAGFDMIDAVGRVIGNVASHEIGHILGNFHTDPDPNVASLMDPPDYNVDPGAVTGIEAIAGIGADQILGTVDDLDVDFAADAFDPEDTVGSGLQAVDVRSAYALSTGAPCARDTDCDDGDVCTWNQCVDNGCTSTPSVYGDVDHNDALNLFDIFCVLDGIAGKFCRCSFVDNNIHPCEPDDQISLFDVMAILDVVGGSDPCCGRGSAGGGTMGPLSVTSIDVKMGEGVTTLVQPGAQLEIDAYGDEYVDLRGVEVQVQVTGGTGGTLTLEDMYINDQRADFAFYSQEYFDAFNVEDARAVCAMSSGGVNSSENKYLATFVFRASQDASGTFTVSAVPGDGVTGTLAADSGSQQMTVNIVQDARVRIWSW